MSTSYSVYVGPYFRCRNRKREGKRTEKGCVNPQCPRHHSWVGLAFCPGCGKPAEDYEVPQEEQDINDDEVAEIHCKERLRPIYRGKDGVDRFAPNLTSPKPPREFSIDPECDEATADLGPAGVQAEMLWLQEAYGKEHAKLKEAYGDSRVEVRWGVYTEYN